MKRQTWRQTQRAKDGEQEDGKDADGIIEPLISLLWNHATFELLMWDKKSPYV